MFARFTLVSADFQMLHVAAKDEGAACLLRFRYHALR